MKTGLAGATVVRGMEGFGASSHIHTSRILRLSEDLPIVVEIVDTAEKVTAFLPLVDEMVADGMLTMENVEVVAYRANRESVGSYVSGAARRSSEDRPTREGGCGARPMERRRAAPRRGRRSPSRSSAGRVRRA